MWAVLLGKVRQLYFNSLMKVYNIVLRTNHACMNKNGPVNHGYEFKHACILLLCKVNNS